MNFNIDLPKKLNKINYFVKGKMAANYILIIYKTMTYI